MTTILNAVRNLDAARDRGEVADDEYNDLRRSLMALVEDAEVIGPDADPDPAVEQEEAAKGPAEAPASKASSAPSPVPNPVRIAVDRWAEASIDPWKVGLLIAGILAVTILALTWIFGDETIAFTLSTVTLAVFVIRAAQYIEEMEDRAEPPKEDDADGPEEPA